MSIHHSLSTRQKEPVSIWKHLIVMRGLGCISKMPKIPWGGLGILVSWLFLEHTSPGLCTYCFLYPDSLPPDENMINFLISPKFSLQCYRLLRCPLTTQLKFVIRLPPTTSCYTLFFLLFFYVTIIIDILYGLCILFVYCFFSPLECRLREGRDLYLIFYVVNKYTLNQWVSS